MTDWNGWLELVAEEALVAVAFLVVFEGCRRLVRDGFSRRAALMVAIGLILPVADAWQSVRVIQQVGALRADKLAAIALHGREPAGGWEKAASSPEARSTLSLQAATVAYMFEGVRTEVLDAQGTRVPFAPSADQERAREQFVRDEKGAEVSARSSFDHGIRLFVAAVIFMLVGLIVGWRQRGRA